MFCRCSNPDCQNAFDYRRGRLFRFHNQQSDSQASAEPCQCVRHFWLCDGCSRTYVLEYHLGMGVAIRPRLGTEPAPCNLLLSGVAGKSVSRGVMSSDSLAPGPAQC